MNREEWQQLAWRELVQTPEPWGVVRNNSCRELPRVVIKTSIMDKDWFESKKAFEIYAPYISRVGGMVENQPFQYQAGLLFEQSGAYWVSAQPVVSLGDNGGGRFICVFHLQTGMLFTAVMQEKRDVLEDDQIILRSRDALRKCLQTLNSDQKLGLRRDMTNSTKWRNPTIRGCLEDAESLQKELDKI